MTYRNGTPHTDLPQCDSEVQRPKPVPTRRRYTQAFKRQVLAQIEAMTPSERGSYLRKEGLYYSMIARWRRELTDSSASAASSTDELDTRTLKRRLEQAERKLKRAEAVIDFQKKALSLLETLGENPS